MMNKDKIPQGYKNSPLGIIPKEWEVKRLGEVFSTLKSFSFSRNQMTDQKQKFRYIHYGDIHLSAEKDNVDLRSESLPYVFDDLISADKITDKSFPLLKNGDIILADASEDYNGIGKAWEILNTANNRIIAGLHTIVLRDRANHTSIGYGRYLFRNPQTSKSLKRIAQGTKVYSISYKHISKLHLLYPPFSEQQKIAEILSCWDNAIEKQSQLIDKLEIRKRGLMQQLLTGKKRIKGFDEKWETVQLKKIGKTFTGLTNKSKKDFGKGKPYIPYLNIFNNSKINISHFENVIISPTEKQNTTRYGDLFFTVSSETQDEVGMSSILLDNVGELYLNSFCFGFRLNDFSTLLPEFARYFFRSYPFRREVFKLSQGATRFNLSKNELIKLKIIIPSLEEQANIANILSTADDEIQTEKEKLTTLKSQKKGLMQQLLTGEKRVKIN